MMDEREKPLSEITLRSEVDVVIDVVAKSSKKIEIDLTRSSSISARVGEGASLSIVLAGEVTSDISIVRNIDLVGRGARIELLTACIVAPDVTFRCDDSVHVSADSTECIIDDRCVVQDQSQAIIRQLVTVDASVIDGVIETSICGVLLGDESRIRAIPELHIASNAVRAKHRVVIARPSKAMMAYFACRGIDGVVAKRMIADQLLCPILGFVTDRPRKTYRTYE